MALHEWSHHPECGDLLILAIGLQALFVTYVLVDREVYKHTTTVYFQYKV